MRKGLLYFALIIVLISLGFVLYPYLWEHTFNILSDQNVVFSNTKVSGQFKSNLGFALVVGLIPLLYLVTDYLAKLNFIFQGIIVLILITSFGYLGWKIQFLKLQAMSDMFSLAENTEGVPLSIDISAYNFNTYILTGLFIGSFISILIFRIINKRMWL